MEYNNKIFVIDAGLKYPANSMFGVDKVVPDISYLVQNKDRVAGIFISHAHEDHYGALTQVLQKLSVPVYATPLAKAIMEDTIKNDGLTSFNKFKIINPNSTIKVAGVSVSFTQMTHSIPETCMISIQTKVGAIVFSSDFYFDTTAKGYYQTNLPAIQKISHHGVHTLLLSSRGVATDGFAGNSSAFYKEVSNMFYGIKSRIIISAYATDLKRIQDIINITVEYKRKLFISGVRGQRLIDIALRQGYLQAPKGLIIGPGDIGRYEKSLVILVAGNSGLPFRSLQRMSLGKDKFVKITQRDTLILGTPSIPGNEKIMAISLDSVYDTGAKILPIAKQYITSSHAAKEDLKLLVTLLNPKFIIPVDGEYRHFIQVDHILQELDYESKDIIIIDNGEVVAFEDDQIKKTNKKIKADDVLIDGSLLGDVSDFVLRDRSQLSEDGIVTISLAAKRKEGRIVSKPKLISRGFVHTEKSAQFLKSLEEIINTLCVDYFAAGKTDWNLLKNEIRETTSKYIYKQTKRKPVIITVILDA